MGPADTASESLGEFLRKRYAEILSRWLKAVRECAPATRLGKPALLDHLPRVLERISDAADGLSRGDWSSLPSDAVVQHAMARLSEGMELRDVLTEFFLLRQVLLDAVLSDRDGPDPVAWGQLVCWAVDLSIRESIGAYVVAGQRTFRALDRISTEAVSCPTLEELYTRLLSALLEPSPEVDIACLLLVEGDRLVHRAAVGIDAERHQAVEVAFGEGIVGTAAAERRPMTLAPNEVDKSAAGTFLCARGIRALYALPVLADDALLGVVQIGSTSVKQFSDGEKALLAAVSDRIAAAIHQRQLRDRAERLARERDRFGQQRQVALDAARLGWWHYDPATRQATYDRRFIEMFGMEGRPPTLEEKWSVLHPDDLPSARKAFEAALDPAGAGEISAEYRIVRRDGDLRWIEARSRATFEGEGAHRRAASLVGTVADITERRRAEQALRESEARLRRLYESGMIGVLYFDLDGLITEANDKFLDLVGYAREDLRAGGLHWRDMTPPEYHALDEHAVAELRASGVDTPYEKEYVRKDGSRVSILIGAAMFDDERHRGIAFVVDITSRKEAEKALRDANEKLLEADRRKNEFLGVLSHELRNPLAPIRSSLDILERAKPGGEQARRAQAVLDRQVSHLTRLVDDLLDVTRISRGKVRLVRAPVDLAEVVRRTLEDHRPLLEEHPLDAIVPRSPLWVDGDATRLSQVVGNLVQNAVKFTPKGGRIAVSLTKSADDALLEVSDSGIGIDPETLARLFEPFAQADRSLSRSAGGLGLGLALVKGLVELHGGDVTAESEGPGKGARFAVSIPLLSAVEAPGPVSQPREQGIAAEDQSP